MKTELLNLMKNDNHQQAIEAVLNSGLLPESQLQKFLDNLTERAVRRVLALPGCSEWIGRAAWDAWAIKWLHSKDRSSIALVRATERIIAATTREAQQVAKNGAAYGAEPIWAAAEAARASHREPGELLRYYVLRAAEAAIYITSGVTIAAYSPQFSNCVIDEAVRAEREHQYDDLLSIINSLPGEEKS